MSPDAHRASWLTGLLNPLVWSSTRHAARKLASFAAAEHASMIDLRLAAAATPSPERAAAYLRHADDEARHTQMFRARAHALDSRLGTLTQRVDTEHLFERLGEVAFLAFVHHGEARACAQFGSYVGWFDRRKRTRDAALFRAILSDEHRHARYTWELLLRLAGGQAQARRELRRVRRWELGRRWLRAGRAVSAPVYMVLTSVLYLLAAPLALLVRWARPERSGWRALGGSATKPERELPRG